MPIEIKVTETFADWLRHLRDRQARTIIAARIARLSLGLAGDVASIGEGLSEFRIHYGAGYRRYFQRRGDMLIILLCGGNKATQQRDVEKAKRLVKQWSE